MEEKARSAAYDAGWKELLQDHFAECLEFFFPHVYEAIDWSKGYESLDKEFQSIIGDEDGVGVRRADILVKVYRKVGDTVWLLIHIEVQGQKVVKFATRMYVYSYRIYDKYKKHPVSLAIFTDSNQEWRPDHYEHEDLGCKTRYDYPTVKLLKYDDEYLMQSLNPFALVVIAHRRVAKLGKSGKERVYVKLELIKLLTERGYSSQYRQSLTRFLDFIVRVPEPWRPLFVAEVQAYRQEHDDMEYLTTWEEIGREEGKVLGRIELFLKLLAAKFGELSDKLVENINAIDDEDVIDDLSIKLLSAESLDELGLTDESEDDKTNE